MDLLALDLGTKTGWALMSRGQVQSAVETFDLKRGESPGMRYLRFSRWLEEMVVHSGGVPLVGLVVYEAPHHRGGAATEVAAGFATHLQSLCARHGIEHASVHSGQLKRWTTGKGNASKSEMLDACARRWRRVDDDNEADALALLHFSLDNLVPR